MTKTLFAFDLDGTVTDEEILPAIGVAAGKGEELQILTRRTLQGEIDFAASFRHRFNMLKHVPLGTIKQVISSIPINPHIDSFIQRHQEQCLIITGNLDCWIAPLVQRLGCRSRSSISRISSNEKLELHSILSDKGEVLRQFLSEHPGISRVVAVGDSVNDIPMLKQAEVGIAYGGVHRPPDRLLSVATHYAGDGKQLVDMLRCIRYSNDEWKDRDTERVSQGVQ